MSPDEFFGGVYPLGFVLVLVVGVVWAGATASDFEYGVINALMAFLVALIWPVITVLGPLYLLGRFAKNGHAIAAERRRVHALRAKEREAQIERDYQEVQRLIQ